jgi:quercetin dioxygenase-like cupin family protein
MEWASTVSYPSTHSRIPPNVQSTIALCIFQPPNRDSEAFTTSEFPVSFNNDVDIAKHDERVKSGKMGIVNPRGTVLRYVDFAPGFESMMHRTRSLDYGIVVEGSIELILDSGEKQLLQRGDCCIQRGTNHAWRNPSETEWTRVVYILQDSQAVEVGDQKLKEFLGRSEGEIPFSGNDD